MQEVRKKARELMKGRCRVCPVCDGRACAGEVPGMGGAGTGAAFQANLAALAKVKLNLRVIHRVGQPDTSFDLWGRRLSLPILAAPIGGVAFNMTEDVSEADYINAVVGGCAEAGVAGCIGDGVPPVILDSGLEAIATAGGNGIPFIKPWADDELNEKLARAKDSGAFAVGMDLDACGLVTLALMGRPVTPRPSDALAGIIERARPLKFIAKGIMTPDEARLALEAGADAIVVSNHGGRVLDWTPGTAEVLPAVAEAVGGRLKVLVDGGVRAGVDVLKMLALGADAVMIGRPFSVAAIGGGQQGVTKYLEQLKGQLASAMILTGCADLASAGHRILAGGPAGGQM